jgi:hypothetical protein
MAAKQRGQVYHPGVPQPATSPRGKRALEPSLLPAAVYFQAADFIVVAEECVRLHDAYLAVTSGKPCAPDEHVGVVDEMLEALPSGAQLAERYSADDLVDKLADACARFENHIRAHQKGYGDRLRQDFLRYRIGKELEQSVGKTKKLITRTSGGVTTVVAERKWTATALREHLAGTFQLANESSVRRLLAARGFSPDEQQTRLGASAAHRMT